MTEGKQKTDRSADPSMDSAVSPQADSFLRQPVPRSFSGGGRSGGRAAQAPSASSGQALRKRAEEKVRADEDRNKELLSPKAARQMLHELRVHQIELEMQNEELRRVEAELEASRARYFDLYDLAPVGYLTLSEQGLILEANLTAATLLGVARGALVKQPVTRFIFWDDRDIYYLHRKKLFEKGAPQVCELRLVKKDGAVFWARLEATAAQDAENGDTVCRVVMSDITERKRAEAVLQQAHHELEQRVAARTEELRRANDELQTEITERKQAEEALRESEERYRIAIEGSNDGVAIVKDLAHIFVNQPFLNMFGHECFEEIVGKPPYFNVHPDDLERVKNYAIMRVKGEDVPAKYEFKGIRKDGRSIDIEASVNMISYQGERTILAYLRDITERKRLEGERLEMERQLQHSQRLESLGVLAGGIAHDFNNILMALMGNLEMAQMNLESSSKTRRYIEAAFKASSRAAEITRQMLAYSGRGSFVVKPTDLSAVVDGMGDLLRSSISKRVSLQFDLCRALPSVALDSGQMEQIIMNVVINASEAIGERSGLVIVRTGVEVCDESYLERSCQGEKPLPGRFVFFEVCDTGCGMDEETQRRLFDPFFTTKFAGHGLGMSAVLGIVRGHKGAIVMESEVGRGTRIKVLFPVLEAGVEEERPREEAVSDPSGEGVVGGFLGTVLVVDDEEAVCDLCREELEASGFAVLTAADGEEGVKVFREHAEEITCVILDLTMPKMDGVAAFGEISRIRPDVRVVLSSGYDHQEALRRFAGQRLSGFIKKPYTLESLRRELERVVKGGEPSKVCHR